ncbi:MAG: DUF2007 domain-containing protein [Anaerolineae bacterium]|nr:DUF2007 domain-containing protein [Anaerolineae bacterium]
MTALRPQDRSPHWQSVYVTNSRPDAYIVAGRLEHEGIAALIHSEAGRDALGIHIGALGAIHVLVDATDATAAEAILYPDSGDVAFLDDGDVIRNLDDNDE